MDGEEGTMEVMRIYRPTHKFMQEGSPEETGSEVGQPGGRWITETLSPSFYKHPPHPVQRLLRRI